MPETTTKKVHLKLVGIDGNAFALMGAFQRQARREGWTGQEISDVLKEAMSSDYDHLVAVLAEHCVDPSGERVRIEGEDKQFADRDYIDDDNDEFENDNDM